MMQSRRIMPVQTWQKVLVIVWCTLFLVILLWHVVRLPKARALQPTVVAEYESLSPPPQTDRVAYYPTMYRPDKAEVCAKYQTALDYPAWRVFYIHEMTSHGWTLAEEKVVYDWGDDRGIRQLTFTKQPYGAIVEWDGISGYSINIERASPLY